MCSTGVRSMPPRPDHNPFDFLLSYLTVLYSSQYKLEYCGDWDVVVFSMWVYSCRYLLVYDKCEYKPVPDMDDCLFLVSPLFVLLLWMSHGRNVRDAFEVCLSHSFPSLTLHPGYSGNYSYYNLRLLGSVSSVYLATFVRCHVNASILLNISYFNPNVGYSIAPIICSFIISPWKLDTIDYFFFMSSSPCDSVMYQPVS